MSIELSPTAPILEPTLANLGRAAAALRDGKLVAFPTETVYGLGGDATSDRAVAAIYAAKGRPTFNPLIVHVASLTAARALVEVTPAAETLAQRFWPGALTLVLPRRLHIKLSLLVSAGLDSVAIRVPAHPAAQGLLLMTGLPLAAPSANPSGKVSPTRAEHVAATLGSKVAMIIDGGSCRVGIESTVLSLLGATPRVLRPGGVTVEEIGEALQMSVETSQDQGGAIHSPGQLESHYAPTLPLRLNARSAAENEALLAFGPDAPAAPLALNLSAAGDLEEAAANLFAMLRELDRPGLSGIAVMPIPERGLGVAINDRLRRAAAPR
ncbi:MAG TPA: L-threonylcarbamoyladenylate synthase [Candidatus Cybelea sp.]|nr:L-threonylcarbamoyladenylate synthase [Candidatus Cybelea sp.]